MFRREHRSSVFDNELQRRIFGPKRDEGGEAGEMCIMGSSLQGIPVPQNHGNFLTV
jgi:hypothetical protein